MSGSKQIRFSVVIPAYNAAATIVRAVQSCLDQSYPPAEIIISDDGSTDGTPALLAAFGHRIRVLAHSGNRGPAGARNAGMDAASGDFIAFLDADDVWHRDKLQLVARALTENNAIRFLFHAYIHDALPEAIVYRPSRPFAFRRLLPGNVIATPCAVLVNDSALRFPGQMRHMEDYAFFLKAGLAYGIHFLDLPLTQLGRPVLSAGGQSADRWAMRKGEFAAWLLLARERPGYFLLLPFLVVWGLLKHVAKAFFEPQKSKVKSQKSKMESDRLG